MYIPTEKSKGLKIRTIHSDPVSRFIQKEKIEGTLTGTQTFAIEDNNGRVALSGVIFNRVRNAIFHARGLITNTMAILGGALTHAQLGQLRITFGITVATQANVINSVIQNYQAILDGLNTNGLVIKDESADLVGLGSEGHIDSFLGFRFGPIHTRFDRNEDQICFNLIHEGSHLWAGTGDLLYMRTDWDTYNRLWGIHVGGINTFNIRREILGVGHNNADSYAILAFGINGLPMP